MNILLTNDDGINSEGLQKLARVLRLRGKHRVIVLAPETNRSGVSHALSIFTQPVKVSAIDEDTFICSGTPADCVVVALQGAIQVKPDIVISGINCGANSGTDIVYSGTAAAARQASLQGVPALAISLTGSGPYNWDMAASWSVDHLDELLTHWKEHCFVNVNIPGSVSGPEGIAVTWPAIKSYSDKLSFKKTFDGSTWCFLDAGKDVPMPEAGSDCDVLSRNFASISSVYNFPVVIKDLCPGAPNRAAVQERIKKQK
ncbi:MAG: 5'/3'-nucleotidase SurE [Treponema sp.]|nr:5'/3'-nucleotidase SurE [Treponema sp.]